MIMPIVVVLPAPLPPSSPQMAPRGIASVRPSTAARPLKSLVRPRSAMAGGGGEAAGMGLLSDMGLL